MRRVTWLGVICGAAAIVYACGGTATTDIDGGTDSGGDATTDSGGTDSGGSDSGGTDSGKTDSGGGDAGCADGGCADFAGDCSDGGTCPTGQVCVNKTAGLQNTHQCYPKPTCGCENMTACQCIGACACGNEQCQDLNSGGIYCTGPISRRELKTDISYVSDAERAELADEALATYLAEYRYKTEPDGTQRHLGFIIDDMPPASPAVQADRTHVDLYGYTSMLLATVQEQQKQIDDLKEQVAEMQKSRK